MLWFAESDGEEMSAPIISESSYLEILSGETVTIESDDSETYEWIHWESGGTLEWESGGKIALAADTE